MSIFKLTRETKIIFTGVAIVSAISFAVAYFYYSSINKSEDPRVVATKHMFVRYDEWVSNKNYTAALLVLDSMEHIFNTVPGYAESYETGIVYNDRASVLIAQALYQNTDSAAKKIMLDSAGKYALTSIDTYTLWIERYGKLPEVELRAQVIPFFAEDDKAFEGKKYHKILGKRVSDLLLAQKETTRRLSVAYTNLGIIQRHQFRQKEAAESYLKAISLWKENPSALSNLNVLYGLPPKDRSVIEKLFPPDKNKF